MKKGVLLAVGVAAGAGVIFLLSRKSQAAPPAPGLANLYGTVLDTATNNPVSGVLVNLEGLSMEANSTITDSDGYYLFHNIDPGLYDVTFTKDGYETVVM